MSPLGAIRPPYANSRRRPRSSVIRIWPRPTTSSASMSQAALIGATATRRPISFMTRLCYSAFSPPVTRNIEFSTQVLILAQRQAVLVAKQAASLDVVCGGRFRLGVGVGWNPVEFVGLNENFRNRGRRSEEQVEVMQALWAEPHVTFAGKYHTNEDAGINPLPTRRRV